MRMIQNSDDRLLTSCSTNRILRSIRCCIDVIWSCETSSINSIIELIKFDLWSTMIIDQNNALFETSENKRIDWISSRISLNSFGCVFNRLIIGKDRLPGNFCIRNRKSFYFVIVKKRSTIVMQSSRTGRFLLRWLNKMNFREGNRPDFLSVSHSRISVSRIIIVVRSS